MTALGPTQRPLRRLRRAAFWGLVVVSIALLFLSPLDEVVEQVKDVAPWVGIGLVVSEVLFVAGLALIAAAVGVSLPRNPLVWRAQLPELLAKLDTTPLFWVGLVINSIGAIGTAVVLVVAIVRGLPVQSWGLLVLPFADLSLTVAIRASVSKGVRSAARRRAV